MIFFFSQICSFSHHLIFLQLILSFNFGFRCLISCANLDLFLEENLGCPRDEITIIISRFEKKIAKKFHIELIMN